eukprot:513670_1
MGQSSTVISVIQENSLQDCVNLLVNGYTTNELKRYSMDSIYPKSINSIISYFVGNMFLKFDVFPSECNNMVRNNGMEIHRTYSNKPGETNSSRFMIGCSRGFNKGINEWKIQTMQDHNEEIIGIMTNINDCKKIMWIGYTKGDTYYYYGGDKKGEGAVIQTKINGRRTFYDVSHMCVWKANDIITVTLDCNKWKLWFKLNDFIVHKKFDVVPDLTYYPVICVGKAVPNSRAVFRIC